MTSRTERASGKPRQIAGIIDRLMASLGQSRRFYGWSVVTRWPEIVGDQIARNARAIAFDDGVLTIAVPSDTWRQELQMQSEMILNKIHDHPGGRSVKRLRMVRGEKG